MGGESIYYLNPKMHDHITSTSFRKNNLAEPVVLKLLEPRVQLQHLSPELDGLRRRFPLLYPTQHIAKT